MNVEEKTDSTQKFEPIVFVNNPISKSEEDVIGFDSQVETLMCSIENNANMVGIIADYGTGKSSMTELLVETVKKTNQNDPIKINMWDCLSKVATDGKDSESVSALTKSFLYQLANGHSTKFGRYINKILSKNYGNISFSSNDDNRFIIWFLVSGILYAIYKMLGISGTGIMQYIPQFNFFASLLKICSPVFLLGALVSAFWGVKDTFIAFSHWKMPNKREPEINDVYDTYSLITEKIIPEQGKQLVFIDDLDRIDKKKLIIEFLKELYRFQDSLGKQKDKLVFIISIKPESQLETDLEDEADKNVYSKIFDITLSLKPIHFDDYDSLLLRLIDSNHDQKEKLERLLDITFDKRVPKEFRWIKEGTNLTLRDMKDRLNQAISIMIALKNKDYKVKTSTEFKSCAAVAYLENHHQKDYYKLIKLEAKFSEFMQSTRLIIDEKTHEDKLPKIKEAFTKCFNEKTFSNEFVDDFCEMIRSGDFNDDYRMYFYTYPKGSHIKTTDERTLCDYILLPNSHSQHDKLDELVSRVFRDGKNDIIEETIESLEESYPTVLLEDDTLFVVAANISFEKTFSTFAKKIICSTYDVEYKKFFWKRLSLLPKRLYEDFVSATIKKIFEISDSEDNLLSLRKSITLGLPDRILDFNKLFNRKVLDFAPQITAEEIKIISNTDISLKLIDIENLEEEDFDFLADFINAEPLKVKNQESFNIACDVMKVFCSILEPKKTGNKLLIFLNNNEYLDDDFFEVICKSGIDLKDIAEYLNLFDADKFSQKYLDMIDNLAFDGLINQKLIRVLLADDYYYTPLLYGEKHGALCLFDDFALDAELMLSSCKKINNDSPQIILPIRDYFYQSKGLKELNPLYFDPFPIMTAKEFSQFNNTIEAIQLIDVSQIDEDNFLDLIEVIYENSLSCTELVALFDWLFDEEENSNCISDLLLKKSIFDSLDFKRLNVKDLDEPQREKIYTLMSDVCVNNTPEDALGLLQKYGCLIPSLEKSVSEDNNLDVEYSKLISTCDEFSSYTLKWLEDNYIRCGLSKKLCEILLENKDFQNYIVADCLRENNMILDDRIAFGNYIKAYKNVDEMFSLMSGHWDFLEGVQSTANFAEFDEKHLIPIFAVPQTERFFQYIFSEENEVSIKEKYLQKFGKFKTEQDSKAFQRLICKKENMELLGSYDLYRKIRYQLWETNASHKRLFTTAWNARWKKEFDEKTLVTLD